MLKFTSMALVTMLSALGCAPLGPASRPAAGADTQARSISAVAAKASEGESGPSASNELASGGTATKAFRLPFGHVIHDGGARVLLDVTPDEAWASAAAPTLVSKGSPVVTRREVDRSKLPPAFASAIGSRVSLMRAGERVCEATITGLSMIGRVEPYFGARGEWEGGGASKRPWTAEEIADDAWKLSDPGGHALAAELGEMKGEGCASATWARDVKSPAPRAAKARPADRELSRRALAALRKLDTYAEIQASYEASSEANAGSPWELSGETELVVSEMSFGRDDAAWVWVSATSKETCGAFFGEISALFEVRAGSFGPELDVRFHERAAPGSEPEAALALPSVDGERVEVLFTGALLRPVASRYQLDAALVPFLDCPC